jgi:hypothetical protein
MQVVQHFVVNEDLDIKNGAKCALFERGIKLTKPNTNKTNCAHWVLFYACLMKMFWYTYRHIPRNWNRTI